MYMFVHVCLCVCVCVCVCLCVVCRSYELVMSGRNMTTTMSVRLPFGQDEIIDFML